MFIVQDKFLSSPFLKEKKLHTHTKHYLVYILLVYCYYIILYFTVFIYNFKFETKNKFCILINVIVCKTC